MATDKHPNQNVTMPISPARLEAARARLDPGRAAAPKPAPSNGNGSRREIRPGEWFDDRRIVIGGPSSPSKDTPPELSKEGRAVPASYDPLKVYSVTLGKSVVFSGRTLSPAKKYMMTGEACTEITAAISDAVEVGDIPVDPDAQPSSVNKKAKA